MEYPRAAARVYRRAVVVAIDGERAVDHSQLTVECEGRPRNQVGQQAAAFGPRRERGSQICHAADLHRTRSEGRRRGARRAHRRVWRMWWR
eukprot:1555011-Prymnesium_polylepis.1